VHADRPLVHRANELMKHGVRLRDLPADVRAAYNAYRIEYNSGRREQNCAYERKRYHEKQVQMTEAEHEAQRAKWRVSHRRRKDRTRGT
jgi:hypothetical protein